MTPRRSLWDAWRAALAYRRAAPAQTPTEPDSGVTHATVESRSGSDRLVVVLPKFRPAGGPPQRGLAQALEPLDFNQLLLGSGPDGFLGPRREARGLRVALEVIDAEARRLGVPPANVVTIGTSMAGLLALIVGLSAGAGRILAGGVPVRMGRQLEEAGALVGEARQEELTAAIASRVDSGDDRMSEYLDELIFELAAAATTPTIIDLFGSPADPTLEAMQELTAALASHDHVDCRLTVDDYPRHGAISGPFTAFALQSLGGAAAPAGRRPGEAGT